MKVQVLSWQQHLEQHMLLDQHMVLTTQMLDQSHVVGWLLRVVSGHQLLALTRLTLLTQIKASKASPTPPGQVTSEDNPV